MDARFNSVCCFFVFFYLLGTQGIHCASTADEVSCPPDAVDQTTKCTTPLVNAKPGKDRTAVIKYCRMLKQIPICLERILHQCQGHEELASIDVTMKNTISQLKTRFDKKCEPICGQCYASQSSISQTNGGKSHVASLVIRWTIVVLVSVLFPLNL